MLAPEILIELLRALPPLKYAHYAVEMQLCGHPYERTGPLRPAERLSIRLLMLSGVEHHVVADAFNVDRSTVRRQLKDENGDFVIWSEDKLRQAYEREAGHRRLGERAWMPIREAVGRELHRRAPALKEFIELARQEGRWTMTI